MFIRRVLSLLAVLILTILVYLKIIVLLQDNYLINKELEQQKNHQTRLEQLYRQIEPSKQENKVLDFEIAIKNLAQSYLRINKTRTELVNQHKQLHLDLTGEFQQMIKFLKSYVSLDSQYSINSLNIHPDNNQQLQILLTLSENTI